jgi:hypothetical protein
LQRSVGLLPLKPLPDQPSGFQRVNACDFPAAPDAIHGRMSSLGEERAKTSPNTPSREAMIGYDQGAQL